MLNFNVPNRRKPEKSDFSVSAKFVGHWVDSLPMANLGSVAKIMLSTVRETNLLLVGSKDRLHFLDACYSPASMVLGAMDQQIMGKAFPLPARNRKVGLVATEFCKEIGLGYKLAALDWAGRDGGFSLLHRKSACLALAKSLRFFARSLTNSYLIYSSPAANIWSHVHGIYAHARKYKLADKELQWSNNGQTVVTTIGAIYRQIILLASIGTHRFTQQDIQQAAEFIKPWSPIFSVNPLSASEPPPVGAFVVDAASDSPPAYFVAEKKYDEKSAMWVDFSTLAQALKSRNEHATGGATLSDKVVENIMLVWGVVPERVHKRLPGGHELDAVFGVHAVHFVLAGNMDFASFAQSQGLEILTESTPTGGWSGGKGDNYRASVARVIAEDQSLGGYRLRIPAEEHAKAKIGELVAISQPTDDQQYRDWIVGVVRWIQTAGKDLSIGMQLLSRAARAISVEAQGPKASGGIDRGILLPGSAGNGINTDAMVVSIPLGQDAAVSIFVSDPDSDFAHRPVELKVDILRILERSTAFCLLELMESKEAPEAVMAQGGGEIEQEMDSWFLEEM